MAAQPAAMIAVPPAPAAPPPPAPASPAPEAPPPTVSRDVNLFAFVVHPLTVGHIHRHFRWTRVLPDRLVERIAARTPPMYLSRITGGRSAATGQRIEGLLYSIGGTPREIMRRGEEFTYAKLLRIARDAERRGARILGLGAFTKVVGDAGVTVARRARIPVTSGNSLTVAATLEAAKLAAVRMGAPDLRHGRAMIVGATGAIGSICARLIAAAIHDVVLVSIEPDRLARLQRTIEEETPGARVRTALTTAELVGECQLVVTATSAFGERVLDVSRCAPGAVVCDVALPPDIAAAEAAVRPDVLVVEGGEVVVPGPLDLHYDVGLPKGVVYACLAEAALLAAEGRFEDFTLGRDLEIAKVKEIYHLFRRHGFRIHGLRSFGHDVGDEDLAAKRALADRLRADPELFARVQAEAAARLARIPPSSKGTGAAPSRAKDAIWAGVGLLAAAAAGAAAGRRVRAAVARRRR
jgi:predicted amino acid dehydrogenase